MESVYGEALETFRDALKTFYRREVEPRLTEVEASGDDRVLWRKAAEAGLLGVCIPEEYGGAGDDGLALVVSSEELGYSPAQATLGAFISTDLATTFLVHYGTEDQKRHWFPKILSGETIQATAITEPQSGSDAFRATTTAVRDGDDYVINGHKHFISNGASADLIYLIARTDPGQSGARGLSVIMVPGNTQGLTRRKMKTMGYAAGDTGDLFLENARVPVKNLIGDEGQAGSMFHRTMALDRLQISARALGAARCAFDLTLDYVRQRKIFGQRVVDFQNTQFKLAEVETDIELGRAYLDQLVRKYKTEQFADRDGWRCKVWFTEMEGRVIDECLQLWGGAGWMDSSPISRMYTAARVERIYVGPNELQKHMMGRRYVRGETF